MRCCVILLLCAIGCGSVTPKSDGGSAGAASTGGKGGSGGGAGSAAAGRNGSAGESGIAASGGVGGTSETAGGAAGSPGSRPLGAGCTIDDQCESGICDSATSMCCTGRSDSCNNCIGGYLTPNKDGSTCAASTCDQTTRHTFTCKAGSCIDTAIDCLNDGICDVTPGDGTTGHQVCDPGEGACDTSNGDLPCYCYHGGVGYVSGPCSP